MGELDAAIASYRKAIEIAPTGVVGHAGLGDAMFRKGRYAEARAALVRTLKLIPANNPFREEIAQMTQACARLSNLEKRFHKLLKGQEKPASARESLDMAMMCRHKRLHASTARFAADAYAADPKLGGDLTAVRHYHAARSAALAAAGKGKDAAKLKDKDRTRLRKQVLTWLRADFALHIMQLKTGSADDRKKARAELSHWQLVSDFAGIRNKIALAKLPANESAAFTKLWADVAAALSKLEQQGIDAFNPAASDKAKPTKTIKK